MDRKKLENYTYIINNERNNIISNICNLEQQILDLKHKLEYRSSMFLLVENIFKIVCEKGSKGHMVLIPLKLKEYFKDTFVNKEDIYTFLHTNLIQSGINDFKIESYNQYKIKNFENNEINSYFDTYLSIFL